MGRHLCRADKGSDIAESEGDQQELERLHLPLYIDTLKQRLRSQLPMLRLLRRPITVTLEKQVSLQALEKGKPARMIITRTTWHYWYDLVDLITRILNASSLSSCMYFGMAQYINFPNKIWYSRSWGSSALTTSSEYARTSEGDIILPGDIIRFILPV